MEPSGDRIMCFVSRSIATIVFAAIPFIAFSTPADAGIGDLLVAPTRIVLDGRKGAEIVLNNIGEEPATYRISVEFRRMVQDGTLQDVPEPTAADKNQLPRKRRSSGGAGPTQDCVGTPTVARSS